MFQGRKPSSKVQVKAEQRRLSAEYKRQIIGEAEKCGTGQLGSLLRREGLTYTQLSEWRKVYVEGRLTDEHPRPQANPNALQIWVRNFLADVRAANRTDAPSEYQGGWTLFLIAFLS